jgi:DNA-binding MarR family transcriptional regulator
MDIPNEIIHQSLRLRIMATLNAIPYSERMEFTRLRTILSATDGNLGAHLVTLEAAAYVVIEKDFVGRKPRTRVSITSKGRGAFLHHVAYLRGLIENPSGSNAEELEGHQPRDVTTCLN